MPKTVINVGEIDRQIFPQPECYEQGYVAADVFGQNGQYVVVSEGERRLSIGDERQVRTPSEFRTYFLATSGETRSEDEWEYNAWWEVYEVTDDGWGACEGEVFYDLSEAISFAEEQAG